MVRLHSIIILTLIAGMLILNAGAAEISLERLDGKNKGDQFALRWQLETASCEARKSPLGIATNWIAIPSTDCQNVLDFMVKNESELSESTIGRPKSFQGKKNRGLMKMENKKWYVDLMTAPRCDITLTHCEDPKLSISSQVALRIEEIVTKNLGRIH